MQQRIAELNDAERIWLASCLDGAQDLVSVHAPVKPPQVVDAEVLDRAYAAWLAAGETNTDRVNQVINAVGAAFGQLLVEAAGFRWVVATDQYGCEMAILALPGRGDFLVYPANLVAKRWESRATGFCVPIFADIVQKVREVEAGWAGKKPLSN